MKVVSIFNKNLKSVARSWPYFVVLFLMPIVLIAVAGTVLNSVDYSNIRAGSVGSSDGLDLQEFSQVSYYDSLSECLFDLTNSMMTVCIQSSGGDEGRFIDIYLDNSNKVVSFYARQFILANLLDLHSGALEGTSGEISSKIALYSTYISRAKGELVEAEKELEDQEKLLVQYRANLTLLRSDFDSVYYPLKEMEPEINEIQAGLNDVNGDVSGAQGNVDSIQQNVGLLSAFLSSRLVGGDSDYASNLISNINSDLAEIDEVLNAATGVDPRAVQIINNLSLIIVQLDSIKQTLDRLGVDLDRSIEQTRRSRERIKSFIMDLDRASSDLSGVDQKVDSSQVSFVLNDAFDLTEDPVLLTFPLLIALIITFTSLVLSNMFILKEVNQRSHLREVISPARDSNFLVADYLVNLFFITIQAVVLFLIGNLLFGLPVSEISIFVLAVFLTASIFIFVGMSIGYLIKHQSLSMLLTIFLLMILVVLSDILAPSILAGNIARFFVGLNPFMILKNILEDRLVLGRGFRDVFQSFFKLGIFFVMTSVIAYLANKFSRETT